MLEFLRNRDKPVDQPRIVDAPFDMEACNKELFASRVFVLKVHPISGADWNMPAQASTWVALRFHLLGTKGNG